MMVSGLMSYNVATICIPVSYYHENIVERAIASANAQTIPCDVMVYFDKERRGAGYSRNRAAMDTETPFIIFLDADDTLSPFYVEETLLAYQKGHYVYTDWNWDDGEIVTAGKCPMKSGNRFHCVTTLLPYQIFQVLGGFNEDLAGGEDYDFYMRAALLGICPLHVPKPLWQYRRDGQRGLSFHKSVESGRILWDIYERNGGDLTVMGCCDKPGVQSSSPMGEKREGDVLAIATWAGIRTEGSADGTRAYRGGNWQILWVNPADIEAKPHLFKKTYTVEDLSPERDDVLKKAGLI